jgi:MFS family permease
VSSNELGFLSVLRQFWRIASFRYIALGCALTSFTSYGVNNWLPSYMIRAHQMSVTEVGLVFAFLVGGGGFLGAVLGGAVCNRLVARDVRWYLWLPTVLVVSAAPIALMSFTAESKMTAVALYIWPIVAGAVFLGPAIAVCHALVAPQFRAQISAVLFFVVNLVGLGLGPLVTGMVSDLLSPTVGPVVALRYGLIAVTLIGGGSVVFFLRAARTLQADLQVQLSCENQRPI